MTCLRSMQTPLTVNCEHRNMLGMANHKYLDPAYSVIRKFSGPEGKLGSGIDEVARITGVHRTRVYRWMRPAEKGGTGGFIPNPHDRTLIDYARETKMPLRPADFFSPARAA